MTSQEKHRQRLRDRIRRAKNLLRYLPRRATIHRYPVLGWFAAWVRKKPYLWSFKTNDTAPSFYVGSILACQPLIGVQFGLALVLSLLLRANLPIMAGIQLISNPFTVVPLYATTYYVGQTVIDLTGIGQAADIILPDYDLSDVEIDLLDPVVPPEKPVTWNRRMGTFFNSFFIGGVICGLLLGAVLDLIYRFFVWETRRIREIVDAKRKQSDSSPPMPTATKKKDPSSNPE